MKNLLTLVLIDLFKTSFSLFIHLGNLDHDSSALVYLNLTN